MRQVCRDRSNSLEKQNSPSSTFKEQGQSQLHSVTLWQVKGRWCQSVKVRPKLKSISHLVRGFSIRTYCAKQKVLKTKGCFRPHWPFNYSWGSSWALWIQWALQKQWNDTLTIKQRSTRMPMFFQGAQDQAREQINHSIAEEMGYCAGLLHCSWTLGNSLTLAWFRYRNRLLVSSRSWECTCSTEPSQGEAMPWTVPGPVRHHHWPPAQKRSSRTPPRNSCLKGKERGERSCETPSRSHLRSRKGQLSHESRKEKITWQASIHARTSEMGIVWRKGMRRNTPSRKEGPGHR